MVTKTKYRKRVFLNKDTSKRAYVIADVGALQMWEGPARAYPSTSGRLEIGDCSRNITLDFNIDSPSEKKEVLYKVRLLREVINNFLDAVEGEANKSDFNEIKLPDAKIKINSKQTVGAVR